MKIPFLSRFSSLVPVAFLLAAPSLFAQTDLTPPVVNRPISDLTVLAGTAQSIIKLKKTFALSGVTGQVVRFNTTVGNIDLELDAVDYPLNVGNFLNYVNSGRYNGTFIHRSIAGFIFQGGGYYVAGDMDYEHIPVDAAVTGEHKGSNVRGTIAMALTGGTNSADTGTSEWFFNLVDNTALDTFQNNQGPFTAFGRVIEGGLTVMDALAAVPTYNASTIETLKNNAVFTDLPLNNYQSSQGTNITPDLVYINKVAPVPIIPRKAGAESLLKLKLRKANTNLGLLNPVIQGKNLILNYVAGQTGTTTITIQARDSAGSRVKTSFTVTVQ